MAQDGWQDLTCDGWTAEARTWTRPHYGYLGDVGKDVTERVRYATRMLERMQLEYDVRVTESSQRSYAARSMRSQMATLRETVAWLQQQQLEAAFPLLSHSREQARHAART